MPKPKKSRPVASKLQTAIEFLSICQRNNSANNDSETHCSLHNHGAVIYDGIIAAGVPIDEALNCCPQTQQFLMALEKAGDHFALTQLSPERLQVKSDDFEGYVPCVKRDRLHSAGPDASTMPANQALIEAIKACTSLVSDKGETLEQSTILIKANTVIATNREMIMEYWHGCNLPVAGFLIPKVAATALGKIKKALVGIGHGDNTLTFWFEDGSWMRTNLHKGKWRESVIEMLKLPSDGVRPIDANFFEAVKKIMPFSEDNKIYCLIGKVASHTGDYQGGIMTLPVEHGLSSKIFKIKNILLAGKYCNKIDEVAADDYTMFFGDKVRAAVWHDKILDDEDIPF